MIEIKLCPNTAIYGSLELRATQLESFVLNPYRPEQDNTVQQETMSIWDIMHSYIQHLMMWNDYLDYHQIKLNTITNREIDLREYRDLALNWLPYFSVIEQAFKFKVVSKYFETFVQWTLDAYWAEFDYDSHNNMAIDTNLMYDLKFSWKRRAKQRVITAKQKIYYTYFTALTFDDWSEKQFNYAIFTTKEKKPRLIIENFILNPRECEQIFLEDFSKRIYGKEVQFWDGKTSWFI